MFVPNSFFLLGPKTRFLFSIFLCSFLFFRRVTRVSNSQSAVERTRRNNKSKRSGEKATNNNTDWNSCVCLELGGKRRRRRGEKKNTIWGSINIFKFILLRNSISRELLAFIVVVFCLTSHSGLNILMFGGATIRRKEKYFSFVALFLPRDIDHQGIKFPATRARRRGVSNRNLFLLLVNNLIDDFTFKSDGDE